MRRGGFLSNGRRKYVVFGGIKRGLTQKRDENGERR